MADRRRQAARPLREGINEAFRAQARRVARVAELGQHALQGEPLGSLFDEAAELAAAGLDVRWAQVLQRDPVGALLPLARQGFKADGGAPFGPGSRSHAGFTLQSTQPVIMQDATRETRFNPSPQLRAEGVRSGVGVIIAGREPELPFGVLAAYSAELRSYDADDVHFLETVANVLAAAVIRRREEDVRRLLLERVMSAQEDERRRIARELHDGTGQVLTTLLVGLRTIEESPTMALVQTRASHLAAITAQAIDSVGRLARGLHPSVLQDIGLGPALARHAAEHAQVLGVEISVDDRLAGRRLPPEVETSLFRIAQEAIANVGKHARAARAWIRIRHRRRQVELEVEDDGCGFEVELRLPQATASGRLGLQGIRERAAFLGGAAQIDSRPDAGTRVSVQIPLRSAGAGAAR